jgi:hypothetical protein
MKRSSTSTAGRTPNLVTTAVILATRSDSNQKLRKDIARLSTDPARFRYVFFAAPGYAPGRQTQLEVPGIEVHAVEA